MIKAYKANKLIGVRMITSRIRPSPALRQALMKIFSHCESLTCHQYYKDGLRFPNPSEGRINCALRVKIKMSRKAHLYYQKILIIFSSLPYQKTSFLPLDIFEDPTTFKMFRCSPLFKAFLWYEFSMAFMHLLLVLNMLILLTV